MFTTIELKAYPELKAIIKAAFPKYAKHKAWYVVAEDCTISGTYWDGGSRSEYVAVDLTTKRSAGAPHYDPPQFGGPVRDPQCAIPEGVAIVKAGTFCGKQATACVYIHPANVQRFLTVTSQ